MLGAFFVFFFGDYVLWNMDMVNLNEIIAELYYPSI